MASTTVLEWLPLMLVIAFVATLLKPLATPSSRFARKRFLTEAEARVLGYLEAALPRHRIMAQVSMGALLAAGERDRRRAYGTRNRFASKIVDFVVVTRDTAEVVALVELDDHTHNLTKDAKRDAMTSAAGYPTIRIAGRPRPTAASVRAAVADIESHVLKPTATTELRAVSSV